ncbi:secreted protein containing Outer membrane protein, OmpA/MotB [gut metagenome]|uniref:Secreted protein containing Outer membrane protein, OmpA/MotB n=1 Tax=gut metagenome TaxID=749906 RepID=J9H275_9ZZZZ
MNFRYTLFMVGSLMATLGYAQEESQAVNLSINHFQIQKLGDKMECSFAFDTDSLHLSSNRSVTLTPMLVHADSMRILTPLVLAGRKQAIQHRRMQKKGKLLQVPASSPDAYHYEELMPYADWMNGATLILTQDLCGCGGHPLSHHIVDSKKVNFERPIFEVKPTLVFMDPEVETVKRRVESGQAFLDFPVNQTVIYPEYRRNKQELAKIRQTIEVVRNDTNTHITHIQIHGYASPEGSWKNNRRLATGRAEALKRYVCQTYQFADSIFTVKATPEDWAGLQKWVEQSDLQQKDAVLKIIATQEEEDVKNTRLQKLGSGETYTYLLKEVYPALRHSDYKVHYTVRAFNLEEAKQILKKRPQLLSLDEMYRIALSYPKGSPSFNEVFDIAIRMFPEDPTANLNVALICIQEKQYERAARYLQKAGDSPLAVHARGILCMMTGQYEEAAKLLEKARQQGVTQAEENLLQLKQKIESKRNLLY